MTKVTEKKSRISPKDFLKSRRPERFSDSVTYQVGRLDRAVLEYQLSTLNKRNKELAFEDFAKQLCEKVTGEKLSLDPFMEYVHTKYGKLYDLN